MFSDLTSWLSAIGSISTAVAAISAVIMLLFTIHYYTAERKRALAAEIRQHLWTFGSEFQVLTDLLQDGSPLILGAAEIVKELEARLDPNTTPDKFWHLIRDDHSMILSVVVTGWSRSELSGRLSELVNSIRGIRVRFTGYFSVLRYSAELCDEVIKDAYSPIIFYRILSEGHHLLRKDKRNEESLSLILRALQTDLQSNASLYYVIRYEEALKKINEFVQRAIRSFSRLSDDALVELSRGSTSDAEREETRTGTMRLLLEKVKESIQDSEYEELSSLIIEIEKSISKSKAFQKLEELSRISEYRNF